MINPPKLGIFIDLPLIHEPKPSLAEVVRLAKTINREAGLALLGKMNLALSVAALDDELNDGTNSRLPRVQQMLIRDTISRRRLVQIKSALGHRSPSDCVVFHRRQVLAAIRLVALFGRSAGGNRLESRDDLDVVADLALAVNSLNEFEAIPSGSAAVRSLAPQLAPEREITNPPRINNALVRTRRMLGRFLQDHLSVPIARDLERLFVFLTNGFSFEAFQDLMFGTFAYFQSLPLDDLSTFQKAAFLNPYAPGNVLSGSLFETFLAHTAADPYELPGLLNPVTDERNLLLDFITFRALPVWRYTPEHYLCIDALFLVEKLASGFYWAVNKALDTDARRHSFSSLWGTLFEDHVRDILRYAIPPESGRLIEAPFYLAPQEEAFDAVVLEGTHAIVFEIKGLFARAEAKYSGLFEPFFRGLSQKFGNQPGGAIQQLAKNIRLTFGLPRRRELPGLPVRELRCVWPVVVVLEPILGLGLASRLLVERFQHRLREFIPQQYTTVRPVVFLQVDDLETIAEHARAGDFSLVDCLREKLGTDPEHLHSFHDFYWGQFVPERRLRFRRNEAIATEYKQLTEAALERFRNGEYKGCVTTAYGTVFPRH
ncbi:MAG TPA: hypothetical protein VNZ26_09845 [Vicinamibacterales bacterium]|jgi:hypothetical protein|nr:hypothetical protein [Vicinamibacterales bacterium]